VDLEDLEATLHVGPVEDDLAVEAAGSQQGRVEHVGPVGGGHHDHVGVRVEAVHLDKDLVERLLALVMATAQAGAALAADRVDLVDEDDARAIALGLVEQVTHAAGADADEHLDEFRTGDAEERHARLTGDGSREQRLTRAWRSHQQHAARDARAELIELLGVLQELDNFLQFGLGFVDAGHVLERDDGLVAEEHAGAALAEAHRLVVGALRLAQHEEQEGADEQDGQQRRDDQTQPGATFRRIAAKDEWCRGARGGRRRASRRDVIVEVGDVLARHLGVDDDVFAGILGVLLVECYLELVGTLGDRLDLAFGHALKERSGRGVVAAVRDEGAVLGLEDQHVKECSRPHDQYEGDDAVAQEPVIQGKLSSRGRLTMLPASDYRARLRSANLTEVPLTRHTRFASLRLRCQQTRWRAPLWARCEPPQSPM
jgi:hypothetical protein